MAKITRTSPFSLHLTDCEMLLIFHLLHEIQESLEGYRKPNPVICACPELSFSVEYGIFDTYCTLLHKVDREILLQISEG